MNTVTGFDFDPTGEIAATIDSNGVCLISNVNTDNYNFHLRTTDNTTCNIADILPSFACIISKVMISANTLRNKYFTIVHVSLYNRYA